MSHSVRSNIFFVFAAASFWAIQWFSNNYKNILLPEWLHFTKTAYGSLAVSMISSSSFLIFVYFGYRETKSIEGISRRLKNIFKWVFYVVIGVVALGIPLDIAIFLSKLHANG